MMLKNTYFLLLITLSIHVFGQNCTEQFVSDSLFKPGENKKFLVKVISAELKNDNKVQLINHNHKYLLKISISEKLGLNESGPLEIKSGTRSFFIKNATLYSNESETPFFLIDVLINYIGTLKDDGITSVVFNSKFETKFAKDEVSRIRKAAKCFYEIHKK